MQARLILAKRYLLKPATKVFILVFFIHMTILHTKYENIFPHPTFTCLKLFNPFSASACPSGYRYQPGDKVGHLSEITTKKLYNIGECAEYCNGNNDCKSIEWSDFESSCVLLTAMYSDGPQWKDYRFCSKLIGIKISLIFLCTYWTMNYIIFLHPENILICWDCIYRKV
jgi:hypothetical protein